MIPLFTPEGFKDYELLDAGELEKLERFGKLILRRPEPQAIWSRALSEKEWERIVDIKFRSKSANSGEWIKKNAGTPDRWTIMYSGSQFKFTLRLGLTAFKHVGVFPEQAVNWDQIAANIKSLNLSAPRFLNLFAYTGAASLAARAAGADVTHVDSIKQVISWANENMELSNLQGIRWVVEDAVKFVQREVKRGKTYHGIIMDPPAYGNGPNGEKWKLEDQINDLVREVCKLLDHEQHFLILNTYSLGFSSLIVSNLLKQSYQGSAIPEAGELYLKSVTGLDLPLGVIGRLKNF